MHYESRWSEQGTVFILKFEMWCSLDDTEDCSDNDTVECVLFYSWKENVYHWFSWFLICQEAGELVQYRNGYTDTILYFPKMRPTSSFVKRDAPPGSAAP